MTNNTNQSSVLSFYAIEEDTSNLTFDAVWQKFVEGEADKVACKQVFHFSIQANELSKMLRNTKKLDDALLRTIEDEQNNGAVYMFVMPTVGLPIDGFHIDTFLK